MNTVHHLSTQYAALSPSVPIYMLRNLIGTYRLRDWREGQCKGVNEKKEGSMQG